MREVVFDIEANGLLDTVSQVWVIAAQDVKTNEKYVFTDQPCLAVKPNGTLRDGVRFLKEYDKIICHNFLGYDYHVLEMFFPDIWDKKKVPFSKCWDTLCQSRCQHYGRPRLKGVKGNHGLEYYGVLFKYPKPPIEDWSYWDEEKLNRVLVDIEINTRTYKYLNKESDKVGLDFTRTIRRTQATSYWYTKQELYGTKGDVEHMKECVKELDGLIEDLRKEVEPLLPAQVKVNAPKCTWEDVRDKWPDFFRKVPANKFDEKGKVIKPTYMPTVKYLLKDGTYDRHTMRWFDIDKYPEKSDRLVDGVYTKVYFEESKMSQHAIVKDYLLSVGWKPTQWNYEKDSQGKFIRDDRGKMIPKSPKLTEDSFDSIEGELGKKIAEYNTYVHRRRTFQNEKSDDKGWINQIRKDGRISAGCMAFSTETGRGAQRGIVNVPSAHALYGANMRKAWVADEGYTLVSVDMDSAQLRILANYMGDPVYTDAVVNGMEFDDNHNYVGTDAHTTNAIAFGEMSEDMVAEARETQNENLIHQLSGIRKYCKNGIYAYLFGAGDEKFANTIKKKSAADGKRVKQLFETKLPALGDLQERLRSVYKQNRYGNGGFIEVAGGTWVFSNSEHKLLNFLLMGSEAQLQQEAICWINVMMEREKVIGNQILSIHDELTCEVRNDFVEKQIQLMSEMYGVASKRIGLDVLVTGTAQAGKSWLDIH